MSSGSSGEICTHLPSGIDELDEILGGKGFLVRGDSFPSILIAGEPGCGKSTLALKIASTALQRHRSSLIVDLEERPVDSNFLARRFNLMSDEIDRIYDSRPDTRPTNLSNLRGAPAVCYSYFPDISRKALHGPSDEEDVSPLIHFVKDRIKFFEELKLSYGTPALESIVVDSLPAIPTNRDDYAVHRGLFKALCEMGSMHSVLMIIVAERNRELDWREFVADIVLELTWDVDEVAGDVRCLRPLKTRYQESWDGRHTFRIIPGKGLRLFPRASAVIRNAAAGRDALSRRATKFCSDHEFNKFLTGVKHDSSRDHSLAANVRQQYSDSELGRLGQIITGSASLLYGEDETRKNVVATRFLQAAAGESPTGRALFIACGTSTATARDILERYWLRGSSTDGDPQEVDVESGPAVFEHVDEFISRIQFRLKTARAPITRVLVDDEAALFRNGYFAHPLRELLRARQITSLFVRTVDSGSDDANREHFDNVIRSRHLVLPTGESRIGYRVLKLRGAAVSNARSLELQLPSTNAPLQLADTFKFYREKADSSLTAIPWHLRLYYPSDDQHEYWNREILGLFATVYAGVDRPKIQPFGRLEADSVFQAIADIPADYPLMGTEIVSFDDYWGGALAERERLVPLSSIFPPDQLLTLQLSFAKSAWRNAPRYRNTDEIIGVPHHIDFGIYSVRTDVLEWCGIKLEDFLVGGTLCGAITWESICQICDIVRKKMQVAIDEPRADRGARAAAGIAPKRSQPTYDLFDFPENTSNLRLFDASANCIDESFLCFVLEVLWRFVENWDIRKGTVFNNVMVKAALRQLHSHLQSMDSLPLSDATQIEYTSPASSPRPFVAVFQRQWFVSNWWLQRRHPQLRGKIAIIQPPVLTVNSESRQAKSLRGDWFLGIVKGSTDLSRAASAIKTLTSEVACRNLQRGEIGLPPLVSLLSSRSTGSVQELQELYEQTESRNHIPNYHRIRTFLTMQFRDIFSCLPTIDSGDELDQCITRVTTAIDDYLSEMASSI